MTTMLEELDEVVGYELDYEQVGKTDTRKRVPDTTLVPFRYICQLEVDGQAAGSGTLIGPQTVLTAGHCLLPPADMWRMRVIPGRNGGKEQLGYAMASKPKPFERFVSGTRTDVGIIQLKERIGDEIGWWTASHFRPKGDPRGTSILRGTLPMPAGKLNVHLSGYPADKPDGCTVDTCGTGQYHTYDDTVRRKQGLLFYENDTYSGHSGSPVWVKRHASMGGHVMVGIHIGALGRLNVAVFIDDNVRKFIADYTLK